MPQGSSDREFGRPRIARVALNMELRLIDVSGSSSQSGSKEKRALGRLLQGVPSNTNTTHVALIIAAPKH